MALISSSTEVAMVRGGGDERCASDFVESTGRDVATARTVATHSNTAVSRSSLEIFMVSVLRLERASTSLVGDDLQVVPQPAGPEGPALRPKFERRFETNYVIF